MGHTIPRLSMSLAWFLGLLLLGASLWKTIAIVVAMFVLSVVGIGWRAISLIGVAVFAWGVLHWSVDLPLPGTLAGALRAEIASDRLADGAK